VPHSLSAFNRLLEPLDGREVRRIVSLHGGDHGVGSGPRALTCVRQLRMLLFAQVAGLSSLRELCEGLLARPGSLYHMGLGVPRRSTLADALKIEHGMKRPVAVFRDICASLMPQVQRTVRRESDALITLLDATPITIRDPRSDWAEADARTRGLKLHLGFESRPEALNWLDLTSAKVSDVTSARAMPIEAGMTYVYDKGYHDFGWWHRLDAAGAFFVSRLKINTKRRDVQADIGPLERGILGDNRLKIGHQHPRAGATNPLFDTVLREVVVERDGKAPLVLITNDHSRPASEIAALYKERWQIELLFKWIKQNLKIKRFLGRSENAVKIQIYVALIAWLLLRLFRSRMAPAGHTKSLLIRLKTAILEPFNLTNHAKPPPRKPGTTAPSSQFALALTA
jgi:putative transposase